MLRYPLFLQALRELTEPDSEERTQLSGTHRREGEGGKGEKGRRREENERGNLEKERKNQRIKESKRLKERERGQQE